MSITIKSIKDSIAQGKLSRALDNLKILAGKYDDDFLNTIILQSARLKSLKRDETSGLISFDNANRTRAQITHALLSLADDLEEEIEKNPEVISPENSTSNINILFLSANPRNTDSLKLDKEYSAIEDAIQLSEHRDKVQLNSRLALQKEDFTRVMLRYKPKIAHFSGHGSPEGEILLVDGEDYSDGIDPVALGKFFGGFKDNLKCVVLNACYSEIQAKEIQNNGIQYVIGMNDAIPDDAAIAFSNAFYSAIGAMQEIPRAFLMGINAMGLSDLEDSQIPQLLQ